MQTAKFLTFVNFTGLVRNRKGRKGKAEVRRRVVKAESTILCFIKYTTVCRTASENCLCHPMGDYVFIVTSFE